MRSILRRSLCASLCPGPKDHASGDAQRGLRACLALLGTVRRLDAFHSISGVRLPDHLPLARENLVISLTRLKRRYPYLFYLEANVVKFSLRNAEDLIPTEIACKKSFQHYDAY